MLRVFSFERELYATLDLVPLAVRRRLDLAGFKLSLEGWRALPLAHRRALSGDRGEDAGAAAGFTAALRAAAERAGVLLEPLAAPAGGFPWRAPAVPPALRARAPGLDEATWASLDDEARYVLVHLASPKREPERLHVALAELGLGPA